MRLGPNEIIFLLFLSLAPMYWKYIWTNENGIMNIKWRLVMINVLLWHLIILLLQRTCVICLGSMKAGKAIFTAECKHSFHFHCIGKNVKHGNHLCPICRCKWKEIPFQFCTDENVGRHRIRVLHPVKFSRPQHVQFSEGG